MSEQAIILDRDGVLNRMVVDPEFGTIDSPLHPSQIQVFSWAANDVARLTRFGFSIFIATNQPSASYGKTTRKNLEDVHERIVQEVCSKGGKIVQSYISWGGKNDEDPWRKPLPGMLLEALSTLKNPDRENSWMVGDGVTDIEAGMAAEVKTAFLGPSRCYNCKIFEERKIAPTFLGAKLTDFVDFIEIQMERGLCQNSM